MMSHSTTTAAPDRPRLLSESDCKEIAERLARFSSGGGLTSATIYSDWVGDIRWARNQVSTGGDVRTTDVIVERNIRGAHSGLVLTNDLSDRGLAAAVRRAERMAKLRAESPQTELLDRLRVVPAPQIKLFDESTYQLDEAQRASAARTLAQSAVDAGMSSAGYVEVGARSVAQIDSRGRSRYFQYTTAQYSVTVRDIKGTGSGWAGMDHNDWKAIDGPKLSQIALDKCLKSQNPVRVEPGRYTVILEPQAVCDFAGLLLSGAWPGGVYDTFWRYANEYSASVVGPFAKDQALGISKLGDKVIDERLTITADPADPLCGFPPFNPNVSSGDDRYWHVYGAETWIEKGRLKTLSSSVPGYALGPDGKPDPSGHTNQGAMHMHGGSTSIDEMITSTKRGLLVTRFSLVEPLDGRSTLARGYTRDGLWLVEDGKISKPCRNLVFTEGVLAALNNVEMVGVSQRTFHPGINKYWSMPSPIVVPALKIRDFNFTSLTDAI